MARGLKCLSALSERVSPFYWSSLLFSRVAGKRCKYRAYLASKSLEERRGGERSVTKTALFLHLVLRVRGQRPTTTTTHNVEKNRRKKHIFFATSQANFWSVKRKFFFFLPKEIKRAGLHPLFPNFLSKNGANFAQCSAASSVLHPHPPSPHAKGKKGRCNLQKKVMQNFSDTTIKETEKVVIPSPPPPPKKKIN